MKRTLEIGKATIEIEMNYSYRDANLDGHIVITKDIDKICNATLKAEGKVIQKSSDNMIYLLDEYTDRGRFGDIYIKAETVKEILKAIEEMHKELEKEFNDTSREDKNNKKIEDAKEIILKSEKRQDEILSEKNEKIWRRNYNNLHNEGLEGYVPQRITIEDVARAKEILS